MALLTYGGIGGGFIRSQPDTSGSVTLIATHPTLSRATGPAGRRTSSESAQSADAPAIGASTKQIRAVLAALLRPTARAAGMGQLLGHTGSTVRFDAPEPGRFVIA